LWSLSGSHAAAAGLSIAGQVLGERHDPVVGATVYVLRTVFRNGRRELAHVTQTVTNRGGEYRMENVLPGRYLVAATVSDQNHEGYAPTYYPDASSPAGAIPIDLAGFPEERIDVRLRRPPMFHVRGLLRNPLFEHAEGIATVALLPRDSSEIALFHLKAVQLIAAGASASFDLHGVPAGSYTLWADWRTKGQRHIARQPLEVTNSDLDDITLTFTPKIALTGRVTTHPSDHHGLPGVDVVLESDDFSPYGSYFSSSLKPDGSFTISGIQPDRYSLWLSGPMEGFYLQSIRIGQQELSAAVLELGHTPTADIEIALRHTSAQIEGVVINAERKPVSAAAVVLVPAEPRSKQTHLYREISTDDDGRFYFVGIAPGDYQLFAWQNVEGRAYLDTEFRRLCVRFSKSVAIREDTRLSVELIVIAKNAFTM
jgi:protocatechuate 3,4-dioxygenase beta subunit